MSDEANVASAPGAEAGAAPEESTQENLNTGSEQVNAAEISDEQQAEIEEALENGDTKEAQRLIKKYQLKVRGKIVEKEIDLSDDEFIKNQLQLAEVSRQSMQEAAELKKAYQKEMERFKANPWEVLQELGLDPDDLAESRIQQRIEEMKKSPEQLRAEERERELLEAREEARRLREEKERIEMEKLQEQAAIQIKDEITTAIAAKSTLPKSPYVEKRVADALLWAMNNGFEDATAEDVVPLVEQEMRNEMSQLFDQVPEEVLEQLIGKKNIERMRKKRVAQVKSAPSVNDIKQTAAATKAASESNKPAPQKIPAKDFFRKLGRS